MAMLRLARAQGLLQGKDLNPAQVTGLMLLEQQDRWGRFREDIRSEVASVKLALLTHDPMRAKGLFPEYFGPDTETEEIENRPEQDEITPEISDDIERWIAQRGGIMTGADIISGDGEWE